MADALEQVSGEAPLRVWHGDADLPDGWTSSPCPAASPMAITCARRDGGAQPDHAAVVAAAGRGVPVLGVCNGFQVLTESGLLPGALLRNAGMLSSAAKWR
jgi:transcriptional regulator GlxA family with amidase domain